MKAAAAYCRSGAGQPEFVVSGEARCRAPRRQGISLYRAMPIEVEKYAIST
jgi:hypothetical protein